jgi:hypothetical protein
MGGRDFDIDGANRVWAVVIGKGHYGIKNGEERSHLVRTLRSVEMVMEDSV